MLWTGWLIFDSIRDLAALTNRRQFRRGLFRRDYA